MADNATDEATFDLSLTNAGMQLIRQMIGSPGWAKGDKQIRKANKMRKFLPLLKGPVAPEAAEAWAELRADVVKLPVRYRATGKECLEKYAGEGQLGTHDFVIELLDAFEVVS